MSLAAAVADTVRLAVKGDRGTGSPAQAAVTRRMCGEWRREAFAFVPTTGDNHHHLRRR